MLVSGDEFQPPGDENYEGGREPTPLPVALAIGIILALMLILIVKAVTG